MDQRTKPSVSARLMALFPASQKSHAYFTPGHESLDHKGKTLPLVSKMFPPFEGQPGDSVGLQRWPDIWLNEGFATWMATKASEQFYPQWQSWLNGYGQKQFALALDARRTSHPIQQPVADDSEAVAAFDGITYNKGQALIRMLETYLGDEVFRDGVRKYIAAHAYGSTTTADLWQALESAAGKPVTGIAASFTEQVGVPLITAETSCSGDMQRMALLQDRFVIAPAGSAPEIKVFDRRLAW
jgi:aminopeptidase N